MTKKLLILSALSMLLLTGCQKSDPMSDQTSPSQVSSVTPSSEAIGFNTYTGRAVTKATTALNADFNVESFLSGSGTRTLYFPSTAYRYASGKYTGDTTRYWPASTTQNLDFYAVSPLKYTNTSSSEADLTPAKDSTIAVTKTDGTTDIVASRLLNAENSATPAPVNLTFGHKLTKVSFTAVGKDTTKKYVIKDFKLNANSTSTYQFGATESWGDSSDEYRYDYVSSDVTFSWTSKASSLGTKYLIPNQADKLTAAIWYQVYDGETLIIDRSDAADSVKLTLPVKDVWGINKNVVYNLTIDPSSDSKAHQIEFNTVTLEDWDTPAVEKNIDVPPAPSVFSVSATKKVNFTKGNLYCNTTKTPVEWHLEANQYDSTPSAPGGDYDASHVSHFFWSNTASVAYAETYSDPSRGDDDYFFCGEGNKLTVDGQEGLYALSKDEWTYLINTRASSLRKYGVTVDSKGNCLIIAPDGYTGTIASSYTAEQWTAAESAGLVCLPAAGFRDDSGMVKGVFDVGGLGDYWSSKPDDELNAFHLDFGGSFVDPMGTYSRGRGHSVRLVYSAQ